MRQVFILLIVILVSLTLIIILWFYHKKKTAYRILVEKNNQCADSDQPEKAAMFLLQAGPEENTDDGDDNNNNNNNDNSCNSGNIQEPSEKEIELVARIHEMMVVRQIYQDSTLTMNMLAQMLNVTRETVSRAINRTTGKNFTRFLNEYRINEAVRILSSSRNHTINFDDLCEQVGFKSRITFHRAFKQLTGLPPAEFKNNS